MSTRIVIRAVILLAAIGICASGCDFLQNGGGGSGLTYQLSKLTVITQGKGSITGQPSALTGGKYPKGTTIQLRAAGNMKNGFWKFVMALMFANSGAVDGLNVSLFDSWGGDLSGTVNPASIQMDSDKTVQAVFSRQGAISITTPGASTTGNTPPPYAEIIYNAGRPFHANYYATTARTGQYLTSSFTFNSVGQCTVVNATDPTGVNTFCTTSYGYNDAGDITTITMQYPSYTQSLAYTYDSLGRVASMTMSQGSSYSQTVICSYDDFGNLQQVDCYLNGVYTYYLCTTDSKGNLTKMDMYDQNGVLNPGSGFTLVYDANGLLTQATLPTNGTYTCTLGWAPL